MGRPPRTNNSNSEDPGAFGRENQRNSRKSLTFVQDVNGRGGCRGDGDAALADAQGSCSVKLAADDGASQGVAVRPINNKTTVLGRSFVRSHAR